MTILGAIAYYILDCWLKPPQGCPFLVLYDIPFQEQIINQISKAMHNRLVVLLLTFLSLVQVDGLYFLLTAVSHSNPSFLDSQQQVHP